MLQQNHDALASCAREYRGRFLSTTRRLLRDEAIAQDAVQDAMLSARRNRDRFRGDSQLSTWVGRIVLHSALTRRRTIRRRSEKSLETFVEDGVLRARTVRALPAAGPSPERTLWRSEIRTLLREAVGELPDDLRTVVVLRHVEDADIADIASQIGITPNAVKIRLHRARRQLQDLLVRRGYQTPVRRTQR